jgi:dCTP deaminase
MILSAKSIKNKVEDTSLLIEPFFDSKQRIFGTSYGLSEAGYDIRLSTKNVKFDNSSEPVRLGMSHNNLNGIRVKSRGFVIASSIEKVKLPNNLIATLKDKSTNARCGVSIFNTVIEPGWGGYITIEITNNSSEELILWHGQPIGQLLFSQVDDNCEPYSGKYQNQPDEPVFPLFEGVIFQELTACMSYDKFLKNTTIK